MSIGDALSATAELANPQDFSSIQRHVPGDWIEAALQATGTATVRRRRLPSEQVLWLVIGMALFRDRSIEDVVAKLDLSLPGPAGPVVAPSAIPPARRRIGDKPVEWLFSKTGQQWSDASANKHRWRGLAVYGIDGTTLRTPDSTANRAEFGGADGHRGVSGYPTLRLVVLMELRSHILRAANFGPYAGKGRGEVSLTRGLLHEIPPNSLTVLDRNFLGAPTLVPIERDGANRHWLTRAKANTKLNVVESLGVGDRIVERDVSAYSREQDPTLPTTWRMRAIDYQREGHPPQTLLTSLLDPEVYPASELIGLYHERWELELGYDELKTELLDSSVTLRSKTPEGVRQELWGVLLAFNLVRLEMAAIAAEAEVPPTRISFVAALRLIQDEWMWCAVAKPGAIPRHLRNLRAKVKRFVLPPRRSKRSYPRAVKIKMSNYARKRPATTPRKLK